MSVTLGTLVQVGYESWRLTFSSSEASATFYVYRDGQLVAETTAQWIDVLVPRGEYPVFTVVDDPDDAPAAGYPGRLVIQWRADTTADYYTVEQSVASVWTAVARVDETGLTGYLHWSTPWLDDVTTYQWRVTPHGSNGVDGSPTALSTLMVRHPDPPDVTVTYSAATGKLTVAAS